TCTRERLYVEPDRPHEREAVALRHRPVAQLVVEGHAPVDELFLEVQVAEAPAALRLEIGQTEVVSRNQADLASIQERAQQALGADAAIVRVRALQQLVEQEKQRRAAAAELVKLPQTRDLGVEAGSALVQRVVDPDARADL